VARGWRGARGHTARCEREQARTRECTQPQR
jgi:hypothetical protein